MYWATELLLADSLAIILVFNTSNGFPAVDPIVPAIAPAANFYENPAPF